MSDRDRLEQLKAAIDDAGGPWRADDLKYLVEAALEIPGPTGDPDGLQGYAAGYAEATRRTDGAYATVSKVATRGMPEVWVGTAGEVAADVVRAVGKGVDDSTRVLDEAGRELSALGHDLGEARRRHERGRPPLTHARALLSDVDWAKDALNWDGGQDSDRVDAAHEAAREGIEDLLAGAVLADDASHRFVRRLNQYATEATAGRLAGGGLTSADRVVLGEAAVSGASHDQTILSVVDMSRASTAMGRLSSPDRERLAGLLARCKSPQEGAYVLKALAAGHSVDEVVEFDRLIHAHGDDPLWLRDRLSPASAQPDDGTGVRSDVLYAGKEWSQGARRTCVPAAMVLARARIDPTYALHLTTGGHPGNPAYDNGDAFARRLRDEQERVYDDARPWYAEALEFVEGGMASSASLYATNSEIGAYTGDSYRTVELHDAGERRDALTQIENAVGQGRPVPLGIHADGRPVSSNRHQMMIIGRDLGRLQIYNPHGFTVWVSEDDFVNGNMSIAAPMPGNSDEQMPDVRYVRLPT